MNASDFNQRIAHTSNTLNDFHSKNWDRMVAEQAFGPPHGLMALAVCCQEEVGELAAAVLGYSGEKRRKSHLKADDVLDAVADCMTYLSLVARSVGCTDLEKLLGDTFNMVSDRAGSKVKTGLGQLCEHEYELMPTGHVNDTVEQCKRCGNVKT